MFKTLIKKVREENSNSSILTENHSEDTNGHATSRDTDDENPSSHRRSNSITVINQTRLPSNSIESDKKDDFVKSLIEIFSGHIEEPISVENFIQTLKLWIDSKEQNLEEKTSSIEKLTDETTNLQNELNLLRNKLTDTQNSKDKINNENNLKSPYLQKQLDSVRSENENLKSTIKSLRTQLTDVETERDDLLINSTDDLQRQFDKQKLENEQQKLEIERLRQALIERDAIIEEQDKRLLTEHETQAIQTDEDTSFVQVLAEPDVDTISKLQAELDDKNRTIKILQQRYNDLRKTLQREFHATIPKDLNQMSSPKTANPTPTSPSATNIPLIHYDSSVASQSDVDSARRPSNPKTMTATKKMVAFNTSNNETSPAILPHTSVENKSAPRNGHRSSTDGQNNTNFKYLKHVLLKFMTSTEDEAIHLIRAVSTLLNFSADEERLLRETLDYKMSWFGKVSRLKPLSSNANF